jgi:hypothetical protein
LRCHHPAIVVTLSIIAGGAPRLVGDAGREDAVIAVSGQRCRARHRTRRSFQPPSARRLLSICSCIVLRAVSASRAFSAASSMRCSSSEAMRRPFEVERVVALQFQNGPQFVDHLGHATVAGDFVDAQVKALVGVEETFDVTRSGALLESPMQCRQIGQVGVRRVARGVAAHSPSSSAMIG